MPVVPLWRRVYWGFLSREGTREGEAIELRWGDVDLESRPRDFPEQLVGGNPQTAWNGRSGDLAGAWIAFRVPEGSHIARIRMSAGFDKRNADGDLFTLNHRIKRVRIKRGGAIVREHTFDTNVRTPQAIPIDAAGGSYRIEIVETLPGTRSAWREACVSELRVLGTPAPDATASKSAPTVGIGAFRLETPSAAAAKASDGREMGDGEKAVAPDPRGRLPLDRRVLSRMGRDHEADPGTRGRCRLGIHPPSARMSRGRSAGRRIRTDRGDQERHPREGLPGKLERGSHRSRDPAGFFVPDGGEIESHNYNDPRCFGQTTLAVQVVRPTGSSVEVITGKSWRNAGHNFVEDGGFVSVGSTSDDVARINVACSFWGAAMKCTKTDLERACHIDAAVVPYNSI